MEENFKAFRLYADQRSRMRIRIASGLFIFGGVGLAAVREPLPSWIERTVLSLPRRTPRAISTPLFGAVVVKDEKQRYSLLRKAFDIGNSEAASALIMSVPEAERTPSEWVNLGVALENQGRFAEALAALTHVEAQADQEPWVLNNRGTARLESGPCDEQVLRQLLADNQRACQLISVRKPEGFERAAAAMWGAGAELHRRLGEREETLKCLNKAAALSGPDPCRLLTHAELVLAEGRAEEARALLIQALDLAHPESRDASKARALLSDLPA